MKETFARLMKSEPVIATVKDLDNLDSAIDSKCTVIFLLCGNIFNLKSIVDRVHEKKKMIFIHVDLIEGFSRDAMALKYIHEQIEPDGIISTKNNQLKAAKELGMLTVQRLFIIDSLSIQTTVKTSALIKPDAIEIMPGIMPKITKRLSEIIEVPVIVGGLINEKEDIERAIESGALGVSTSCRELW